MKPREQWQLDTQWIGRRVLVFDCVDSTNTLAAALANDRAQDGVVVLANEQSAGRGQHGRSWLCTPGTGVLLSVLLFPPRELRRPAILAAWAAVSVCETIRQTAGVEASIKWPNDVLIQGRKVCGILIEQAEGTVVGVGLNVRQSAEAFVEAGLPQAGSLAVWTEKPLECADVARHLICQLDQEYERLSQGDGQSLEARWKQGLGLLGKPVVVEGHEGVCRGRLRELAWAGLILETADGTVLRLLPEAARHIHAE